LPKNGTRKVPGAKPVRKLGGAIFGDYRYGTVFVCHNGADSYYAARGFRCSLRVQASWLFVAEG
jgi:hypothetical protein